jgi:DNA-binding transcriptional MerR regulator
MAKELHQLDLFGNPPSTPVHIKRTKAEKQVAKKPVQFIAPVLEPAPNEEDEIKDKVKDEIKDEEIEMVINDTIPTVSRAPMNFGKLNATHKRGRKSFASMEGDIDKLNVPSSEELAKKLYYPIGEVAVWFNVNTSLIRYWEKEFKQLQPRKTRKGDRLFRAQDVEFLKQIYYLLREKKYSIDGAKTYLKNNKKKAEKDLALLNSLKNIKGFLVSLKSSL